MINNKKVIEESLNEVINGEIILDTDKLLEETSNNIENIVSLNNRTNKTKEKLLQEELYKKLWNYNGMTQQQSYNFFMNLSYNEIKEFDIGGNKITNLKNISGINIKGNIQNQSIFREWIDEIFKCLDIEKQLLLNKDNIYTILWNHKGMSEQESYNFFINFTKDDILNFKLGLYSISDLKNISGIKVNGSINRVGIFKSWVEEFFKGTDIDKKVNLTKQIAYEKLWNYKGMSEQQSYNYFMTGGRKVIRELDVLGNKVTNLKIITGVDLDGNIEILYFFRKWIQKIFDGRSIDRYEIFDKEKIYEIMWNYKGMSEQESYEYFMSFKRKDILKFNIGIHNVSDIRFILGIKTIGSIDNVHVFKYWINKVFDGRSIYKYEIFDKEKIYETMWNYKGMSLQESYDYFMSFETNDILNFYIGVHNVDDIREILGIKIIGNINEANIFKYWINQIFDGRKVKKNPYIDKKNLIKKILYYNGMTKQENYDFFTEFKKKLKENKIKKIEKIEKDLMLDIFYSRKYSVLINSILNDN